MSAVSHPRHRPLSLLLAATTLALGFLTTDVALAARKVTRETIALDGVERTYYLAVPEDMKPEERLPLVLVFHGSGRNGESIVDPWVKLARKERLIVVGPDSANREMWAIPADGPAPVHRLVETLRQRLPIDPARMYLFGHSAGAVFALRLGLFQSEYFAAVAVHAGSFRAGVDYATIAVAQREIPTFIIVGDRDQFFPLASVEATIEALRAAGIPADSHVMKGHDHWYYNLAGSINARAWEFLARHALPGAPSYREYTFD